MQNTTAIVLSQSGAALVVRNEMQDSGSISVGLQDFRSAREPQRNC